MTTRKLKYMPYASAHLEIDDNSVTLVSYKTPVATICDDELYIRGLYSATTRRHIRAFLQEFVNFYMDFSSIRQLANENIRMNIITGEITTI